MSGRVCWQKSKMRHSEWWIYYWWLDRFVSVSFWKWKDCNTLNSTWKMNFYQINQNVWKGREMNTTLDSHPTILMIKGDHFLFHRSASHSSAVRFLLLRKRRLDIRVLGSVPFHSCCGANKKSVPNSYETLASLKVTTLDACAQKSPKTEQLNRDE